MIISNINFFISCVKELRPLYQNINNNQQRRQLETFVKTWLWYNSNNKLFWTGKSSEAGLTQRVKEHQYSNLCSIRYMMNDDIGNECFFDISNKKKLLFVFKSMQWNYTSREENNSLREFQDADIFFANEINGNPEIEYQLAGIELITEDETADMMPKFNSFFEYENNQEEGLIFEIDLSNQRLTKFIQNLTEACTHFGIELQVIQLSRKGCIYRLRQNHNNFTDLYRITMFSLWKCFSKNEIKKFLSMYNYAIADNGPYRNLNNFQYPNRAFEIDLNHQNYNSVYLDTYNDIQYKYNLMSKILDFFDGSIEIYDFELNKQLNN